MTDALTYFTGVPCPKGHIAERYVSNSVCLDCKKLEYKSTGTPVGQKPCEFRVAAIKANEKFYITNRPCKRGHISKRLTKTGRCEECFKITRSAKERQYSLAKYGITPKEYDEKFLTQNGVCAICKKPEVNIDHKTKTIRALAVDHCHDTGRIRKLLCSSCNMGIGQFNHNPELLRAAAIYCEET